MPIRLRKATWLIFKVRQKLRVYFLVFLMLFIMMFYLLRPDPKRRSMKIKNSGDLSTVVRMAKVNNNIDRGVHLVPDEAKAKQNELSNLVSVDEMVLAKRKRRLWNRAKRVKRAGQANIQKNNNFRSFHNSTTIRIMRTAKKDAHLRKFPNRTRIQTITRAFKDSRYERTLMEGRNAMESNNSKYARDGSLLTSAACDELRFHPRPYNPWCRSRNRTSQQCRDGVATMVAQHQQDYYLYMTHFRHLQRIGYYVDIAANEPVEISNTWFFDKCLQWPGICVDANPRYVHKLRMFRSCQVVDKCVSSKKGENVRFVFAEGLGGIVHTNKNSRTRINSVKESEVDLTCTDMRTEFEKKKVNLVDYLSLDVEGHELEVLKGIDWNQTKLNVITIESESEEHEKNITEFLEARGYVKRRVNRNLSSREPAMLQDVLYVRNDVVWGKPV